MSLIKNYTFFKPILIISTLVLLIIINTYSYQVKASFDDNIISYSQTNTITHQQTKAQVELFREALDNFGAASPEQVIDIWIKAVKSRNGALHYAVASDELKERIIMKWGEPKDSYWICGTSSPWLDKYEIVCNKKLSDYEYEVKIKYYWRTSSGPTEPSETTLTIIKTKDIWCVKEVRR